MNGSIQLSTDLMDKLYAVMVQHDEAVENDLMIGLQYLSAVIGYFAAEYPGDEHERNDMLEQLSAFTKHVTEERVNSIKNQPSSPPTQPNAPKGQCVTSADNAAVGVWTPE